MGFNIDKALQVPGRAIQLRAERSGILASNIANADTPGFKARDMDFAALMSRDASSARSKGVENMGGAMTPRDQFDSEGDLMYRVPQQPSLDQNTVDTQIEQAAFTENAIKYQAALTLLNGRIRGLMTAIQGQ
jgi:flagellar basal-body rod protein FlgB